MLTWKIFVIIMSVAPLILVNVNSSGGASSSGPPKQRRSRKATKIDIGHLMIYNPVNRQPIRWSYNTQNYFYPGTFEYDCYEHIKLFCENEYKTLKSKHCVKKAFQYYKSNLQIQRTDGVIVNLSDAVYNYFANFQMNAGTFRLPDKYCEYEAGMWMARRKDISALVQIPQEMNRQQNEFAAICEQDLADYQALVQRPEFATQKSSDEALYGSRNKIARFALLNKSFFDLIENSFEWNYLNTISDKASAVNNDNNPYDYCRNPANNPNNQTRLSLS